MKKPFEVKQKAFFIIFKGLSVVKNCLRPENALLNVYSILLCPISKLRTFPCLSSAYTTDSKFSSSNMT